MWVGGDEIFRVFSTEGGSFEIVGLVEVEVRWHEVVHDDEVDLTSVREFDAVEAVESGEEGMRVGFDVIMIVFQDLLS